MDRCIPLFQQKYMFLQPIGSVEANVNERVVYFEKEFALLRYICIFEASFRFREPFFKNGIMDLNYCKVESKKYKVKKLIVNSYNMFINILLDDLHNVTS